MKKVTKLVLMLSLVLLGAFYNAYCATETENGIEKNKPKIAIIKSQHGGTDKSGRMLNLYRNLRQAGRNTRQLTQQEIEDIEDIAENSTGTPQRMAQNILEANSLRHFADCPSAPYPEGDRGSSAGEIDPELYGKAMGLSIDAKPNPATTWTAIDYTLPGDAEKATLTLTNALGIKVAAYNLSGNQGQKVLDLRGLAGGIYTCTVACGEYFQTQKIVITQ